MSATKNEKKKDPFSEFFAELLRRRVLQIAGAYIAGAWLGAEIFDFLFDQFGAPGWAYRTLAVALTAAGRGRGLAGRRVGCRAGSPHGVGRG